MSMFSNKYMKINIKKKHDLIWVFQIANIVYGIFIFNLKIIKISNPIFFKIETIFMTDLKVYELDRQDCLILFYYF